MILDDPKDLSSSVLEPLLVFGYGLSLKTTPEPYAPPSLAVAP
jgi:hypothetical protein